MAFARERNELRLFFGHEVISKDVKYNFSYFSLASRGYFLISTRTRVAMKISKWNQPFDSKLFLLGILWESKHVHLSGLHSSLKLWQQAERAVHWLEAVAELDYLKQTSLPHMSFLCKSLHSNFPVIMDCLYTTLSLYLVIVITPHYNPVSSPKWAETWCLMSSIRRFLSEVRTFTLRIPDLLP